MKNREGCMRKIIAVVGALALASPAIAGNDDDHDTWTVVQKQEAQAAAPVREISKIAGEIYRFRNNFHYSVFAVTPAGVIVTDPIDAEAAKWLKAEIAQRWNRPIKYLVYSHDHRDHIAGGEVFADTAIVVAHRRAKEVIIDEKRPTAVPNLTFDDALTIELGGTVLELTFVGKNHSDNSLVMRFPKEKVAFTVDWIPIKAMPFRDLPDGYLQEWFDSLKRVEAMEFDIMAPGHGPLGTKADVVAFRGYLEELRAEVTKLAREGKSLDDIKKTVTMEKYKDWSGYAQMRELNVEGMYRLVQGTRRPN
ncbi:MAG: MBL fold metallo-hydrolase [Alphaproteobacteria bacterium]|nr:MBL fold metallo-hydrolase [Alphaproteobacteria bacterium]